MADIPTRKQYSPIEHGSVLKHIGQDYEDNLRPPNVHLIDPSLGPVATVGVTDDGVLDVQVHLILRLEEEATDEFSRLRLDFDDGPLSVVEHDDGDANTIVPYDGHGG